MVRADVVATTERALRLSLEYCEKVNSGQVVPPPLATWHTPLRHNNNKEQESVPLCRHGPRSAIYIALTHMGRCPSSRDLSKYTSTEARYRGRRDPPGCYLALSSTHHSRYA